MKKILIALCFSLLLCVEVSGQMATNITFNELPPGGPHNIAERYTITANGVNLPVVDGYCKLDGKNTRGYLHYDYTTFSASAGKVTVKLQSKSDITSIQVSPLKLNIELRKIDAKTYEFDIPEPIGDEQYYTIAQVNGNRVVIARDPEEVNVPVVGNGGVFNVTDKLAGLDATVMTNAVAVAGAFQEAVNDASAYGTTNSTQGVVYVPKGLFYMGNLMLKSNATLYLAPGAVLRFSDNKEDYKVDFRKQSVGRDGTWWIYTENNSKNIKIYGRGTIDGNGHYLSKDAPSDRRFANNMLMIMGTENFVFDGPIVKEGALWGTIVSRSNDVVFRNSKFFQSMDQGEDDGIDVCESQRVLVEKSIGISLDDPYSTKTWEQATDICPNWYGEPEELVDVTFKNCVTLSYCGGFKCGHGAVQKQSNILVKNGVVIDAGWAIGIEPKYSTGERNSGFRDIRFENIDIERYGGNGWLQIHAERKDVGDPPLKGVVLKDINIRHRGSSGSLLGFDDENMMEDITFDNITLYGNTIGATNFAQMNIMKTGFYKNVVFAQAPGNTPKLHIEAEYLNKWSGYLAMKDNVGDGADAAYPAGQYITSITNGNYALYNQVDLGSNTKKLILRANILRKNTTVEVRIDDRNSGAIIGSAVFQNDEAGVWRNHEIALTGATGEHDLYIIFKHATASSLNLMNLNYIELDGREFIDLQSIAPEQTSLKINVDATKTLGVVFSPADAYQREITWSIENGNDVVSLTKDGQLRGLKEGTATVRATSHYNSAITTTMEVEVEDLLVKDVIRIEAESADILCDTYHHDNAISIGTVNDPDDASAMGLNSCWNTNFAVYKDVDFSFNTIKATIRKGYPRGSKIELWIDRVIDEESKTATGGTLIGSVEFPAATSDWTRWQTFETEITGASGVHDLCLVFLAGGGSATNQNYGALNWIEFTRITTDPNSLTEDLMSTMTIYPNPVVDKLFVESDSDIMSVQVVNALGTMVYVNDGINEKKLSIPAHQWGQGLYVVHVKTTNGKHTYKVLNAKVIKQIKVVST